MEDVNTIPAEKKILMEQIETVDKLRGHNPGGWKTIYHSMKELQGWQMECPWCERDAFVNRHGDGYYTLNLGRPCSRAFIGKKNTHRPKKKHRRK